MYFKFLALLQLALIPLVTFGAKFKGGEDLEPDAPLRIGIKHRIPEADCPRKTKGGDKLSMHYTGVLFKDGEKFDSSLDRGTPFEFTLGQGMVIKGWDNGLRNMCIGEKRKLTIPSDHGYGDRGAGADIHAGATLVFEVELLDILNEGGEL